MDDRLSALRLRFTDYCSIEVERTQHGALVLATSHTGVLLGSCYLPDDQTSDLADTTLYELEQTLIIKRARG
jgi:hypothetical protein